jgi:hypothetical protein
VRRSKTSVSGEMVSLPTGSTTAFFGLCVLLGSSGVVTPVDASMAHYKPRFTHDHSFAKRMLVMVVSLGAMLVLLMAVNFQLRKKRQRRVRSVWALARGRSAPAAAAAVRTGPVCAATC